MRDVIHGNDGVHEWGTAYDDDGNVLYNWCESLAARQELLEDGIDPDCPLCQQGSPTRIQATNWNDRVGSPVHDLGDGSFRWCSGDGLPRGRR